MFGWGQHSLVTKSTDGDEFVWFELSSLCGSVRKQPAQPWVSDSGVRRKGQKKKQTQNFAPHQLCSLPDIPARRSQSWWVRL